jgi:hypothetical protein
MTAHEAVAMENNTHLPDASLLEVLRIVVAEYARTAGMRDPTEIETFARSCVDNAIAAAGDDRLSEPKRLLAISIREAVKTCGLVKPAPLVQDIAQESESDDEDLRHRSSKWRRLFSRVRRKQTVAVPEQRNAAMPQQPLGDLPELPASHVASCLSRWWKRPSRGGNDEP